MDTSEEQIRKENVRLKWLYPGTAFSAGTWMTYFSTYLSMLYTDVYMLPVVLSGALDLVSEFTRWLVGPIWGTIIDRVTLKSGKYWPWIAIAATSSAIIHVVTFGLPAWSSNPAGLAGAVFVLEVVLALVSIILSTTLVSVYPRLADDPKDRTFLAMGNTIGRTGAKTVFGFLVPIMIAYFTARGGSVQAGWAGTAIVMALVGWVFYLAFALALRGSRIEKAAVEAKYTAKVKPPSLLDSFKSVFTNGPLFIMFLVFTIQKVYDLGLQTNGASYFWKYFMKDFSWMGPFMTVRSLCHALGTGCGLIWLKLFKDSKRAFTAGAALQSLVLGLSSLVIANVTKTQITVLMCISQFCIGLTEAYVLPFFAAACDWARLKTGVRAEGLSMSIYAITLTLAGMIGVVIRAGVLEAVGYDATAYAQGAPVPAAVATQIGNLMTLYPFLISLVVLVVFHFYPINDVKLREIKAALKEKDEAGDGE